MYNTRSLLDDEHGAEARCGSSTSCGSVDGSSRTGSGWRADHLEHRGNMESAGNVLSTPWGLWGGVITPARFWDSKCSGLSLGKLSLSLKKKETPKSL